MSSLTLRLLRVGSVLIGVLFLSWLAWAYTRLPAEPSPPPTEGVVDLAWPEPVLPPADAWSVFHQRQGMPMSDEGPLGQRYRLAGTFFAFGQTPDENPAASRRAILDDVVKNAQFLVHEGSDLEGVRVIRIYEDRVILRGRAGEEELWLSFSDVQGKRRGAGAEDTPKPDETVLETSRFGKRVGESKWVLKDEALRAYYQELLDDPERLASLYMSMKPDYVDGSIKGYYLDMEGEEEFFGVLGLENGDTVRRVNSMNMISQARAEYFIREFMKGRLGAVVLDVEREDKPTKRIYLIR